MDGSTKSPKDAASRNWIAVFLLDGFSMLSLGAICEPFHLFRKLAPEMAPRLQLFGPSAPDARSRCGVTVHCAPVADLLDCGWPMSSAPRTIVLCGPTLRTDAVDGSLATVLRWARKIGIKVIGVGDIAIDLSAEGLLERHNAAVHWAAQATIRETAPQITAANRLFLTGARGGTCAGEAATLDLALHLISRQSKEAGDSIRNQLLVSNVRPGDTVQPGSQTDRLRHVPPIVARAAQLMARNIEHPLRVAEIAAQCRCSVRHLERSFRAHLNKSPFRYYLSLRIERAHQLVSQTRLPMSEIALACGFQSSASLTNQFKRCMGVSPSYYRKFIAR